MDSWLKSLLMGRVGAGILTLVPGVMQLVGIDFTPDDTNSVSAAMMATASGVGGLLAIFSKLREKLRIRGGKAIGALMVFVFVGLIVMGCAIDGRQSNYTSVQYPDSLIIQTLESLGMDSERVGKSIAGIVAMEVAMGRIERQAVLDFIREKRPLINGNLKYNMLAELVQNYGNMLFTNENEVVSHASIVGYMVLMSNIDLINIDSPMVLQDQEIVLALMDRVDQEVRALPAM